MNELFGLKAHRTLAPAKARYANKQMMWGGQVSLPRRERFCAAKTAEIAAMAGQKILFSGRASAPRVALSSVWTSVREINNGDTIKAKTHAEIGRIANLSIIVLGAGPLKAVRDAPRLWRVSWFRTRFVSDIRESMPWLILRVHSRWFRLPHGRPSDPRSRDEEPPAHHLAK
jgi:hypothetical protein